MAYFPKNKAKIKPSKEGDFIYQDDKTPFNGNYIQTSKDQYYEGDDINFPGRVIIPTKNRQQKNLLLNLLKNLLLGILTELAKKLLADLLASLLAKLLNPGDIFNAQQAQEILNNAEGRDLTEQEQNEIKNLLDQIESEEVELDNTVISNSIYNNLKPNIFNKLNQNKSPISTKIKPKDEDYNNESYIRYFIKRNNSLNKYFEVNKSTYDSLSQNKTIFDPNLYQAFSIKWSLGKNSREINTNTIARYEQSLPGIQNLFNDPTEFAQLIKINQFTEGNELYFEDGKEYIGEYHIHPIEGPMVGAFHIQEPHAKLYYSDELGTSKNESSPTEIPLQNQRTGLFRTIGGNEYYIKENKLGIYAEVVDTITEPPSVIYTSKNYLPLEISSKALIELAIKEVKKGTIKARKISQKFGDSSSSNIKTPLRRTTNLSSTPQPTPQPTSQPTSPSRGRGGY